MYDLDGTLYESTDQFDYYAEQLVRALPADRQSDFRADYTAGKNAAHTLCVGHLYDAAHDLVLTMTDGHVQMARRWDGKALAAAERAALYPGAVAVDHHTLMNVGDLWWVPTAVAAHYGLSPAERWQAFLNTRDYMAGPDFSLTPVPGLAQTLTDLRRRGVVQVLTTNSPQPDSEILLHKAGLDGLLDRAYFLSNKPAGFPAVVREVCQEFGVAPPAMLSVGDNYVNELAPARELGMRTAFIDPHDTGPALPCDLRVGRVAELLPYLHQIGNPGA